MRAKGWLHSNTSLAASDAMMSMVCSLMSAHVYLRDPCASGMSTESHASVPVCRIYAISKRNSIERTHPNTTQEIY
jgi:hypothetical protein